MSPVLHFFQRNWPWVLGVLVLLLALLFFVFSTVLSTFLKDQYAAVTAFATIVMAIFTIVLAGVTHEQMKLTRQALIADKRAYVFPLGLHSEFELDSATQTFSWRFRARWK